MWNKISPGVWFFGAFLSFGNFLFVNAQMGASGPEPSRASLSDGVPFYARKAFDFPMEDTAFVSIMDLEYSEDSLPVIYSSIVSTAVCDDGLCQTLELKMYWDLIGNYIEFDTVPGVPLTKYDHLPFAGEDYEKLHSILADQNSILERKALDELFDKDNSRKSNTVDAVTGATAKAVKNAVVEGALYSSYTLWHIANGDIKTKIRDYTKTIYTPDIGERLLRSEDYQGQLFALKLFKDEDFTIHFNHILELFAKSNPLVEMYILKRLPDPIWQGQPNQNQLIATFPHLNANGQSMLVEKLIAQDAVDASGLLFLSEHLDEMSVGQLKDFLILLEKNPNGVGKQIKDNLKSVSDSMENKAFYIEKFMKNSK